jgi:very-short-patch-repair endonuclease
MTPLAPVMELAAAQHGLLHRADLAQLGISRETIRRWCRTDLLEPLHASAYRLTGAPTTWEQRVLTAVWGSGPAALASHRTAAALWGVANRPPRVETISPYGCSWAAAGAHHHETRTLRPIDRDLRASIPVTSIERTVIDCASVVRLGRLAEVFDDAVRTGLTTYESVHESLLGLPTRGRRGVRMLRTLLAERLGDEVATQSGFEALMARVLRSAGLPPPRRQWRVIVGGRTYFLDFAWPHERVAVECDSMLAHSTPSRLEADLIRQNDLVAAGWTVLRFTRRVVEHERGRTAARIRAALSQPSSRSVTPRGSTSHHME